MEQLMITTGRWPETTADDERGSALVLALLVTLVVSVLALGLIAHSMMVTRVAGAERWSVKTFYAADSGLNVAQTRAKVQELAAFDFDLRDLRTTAGATVGPVNVAVEALTPIGAPRLVIGSEANAGQGVDTTLIIQSYRTRSVAVHPLTNSERAVAVIFGLGPMPAAIPD
jgi:hypothetical protein